MKLHVGCGSRYKAGYVNLELARHFKVDLVASACRLPFKDNSFIEVCSYHVLEHLPRPHWDTMVKWRPDCLDFLKDCYRVLVPNGTIVIECPNGQLVLEELSAGNETRIDNLFGLDRYIGDTHQWCWTPAQLETTLLRIGFKQILHLGATDYHKRFEPCQRIEAIK